MSNTATKPIRSPSYPTLGLQEAVVAVGKIENVYRSSSVDRIVAAKILGYSGLSGPSNMVLASLASYGFVERAGKGEMRVTDRARSVLHPDNSEERRRALLAAALEPHLYRELRERFADIAVPPEDGVVTYLNRQGFNPGAVKPAAKSFLMTMAYIKELGVSESHGAATDQRRNCDQSDGNGAPPKFGGARVGDLVQWESDGALRLERPLRVRYVSDDGDWIAVEGSETGLPMKQVIVEERCQADRQQADPTHFPLTVGTNDQNSGSEGTDLRFKLAKGVVVQIRSREELGEAELSKLVTLLSAQRDALKN